MFGSITPRGTLERVEKASHFLCLTVRVKVGGWVDVVLGGQVKFLVSQGLQKRVDSSLIIWPRVPEGIRGSFLPGIFRNPWKRRGCLADFPVPG